MTAPMRILVALGVVLALAATGCSSEDSSAPPPAAAPITGTGLTPVKGLSPRNGPATAWAGDRLFVYGGFKPPPTDGLVDGGALVDVMSGAATALPTAPFKAPLFRASAARAGDAIVVIGIECRSYRYEQESSTCTAGSGRYAVASYDVARGRWTAIPTPRDLPSPMVNAGIRGHAAIDWTPRIAGVSEPGDVVFTFISETSNAPDYWVLTPATARWRAVTGPGPARTGCIAGEQIVVMTAGADGATWVAPTLHLFDLAAPGTAWRAVPLTGDPAYREQPTASCMGQRVLAVASVSAPPDYRVYDTASSSWSADPPPAPEQSRSSGAGPRVRTGAELLFLSTSSRLDSNFQIVIPWELIPGWAYNPTTNTWRTIPKFPTMPREPIWTGAAVVAYDPPMIKDPVSASGDLPGPQAVHYTPS